MQKNLTESHKKYFVNMDEYLCSVGLYRKRVAQDASSLFRAVSEKLYYSQSYHQKIRQDCADFMRANRCNFEPFVEGSFEKYLERLEDPKETVGLVEIKALSQLYRHCFLIYRYPGEPAVAISEDNFVDKVTLCASNKHNNHYDIIYPRSYIDSAALCQSLLYELLYTKVFGIEEAELCEAVEAFTVRYRHYRNRSSVCRDVDLDYDTPEDRCHREKSKSGGAAEEKLRDVIDDTKLTEEAPPPSRLSLPYKVMKSLDGNRYRNLEFDVWLDTCKETQKKNYMVFEGRQYFLGDKCQVCLGPKGKYYNAFIQEVGTHSSAVTVFIEELAEKHLVPLTDLIPVKPVPAWNIADPTKKGDLDSDSHGQQSHRRRYSRKSCSSSRVKGAELLMPPPPYHGGPAPSYLSPHFQPHLPPSLSPGALTYTSPHYHHPQARPPCTRASSCTRWQLPTALNGERQTVFPVETMEEPTDLDAIISYYQLDDASDAVIPPLPGPAVAPPPSMGAPPPLPPPPTGNTPVCSSEEDQDQSHQTSGVYTAAEPSTNQVVKPLAVICSSSSSSSSPSSEFGEPRCTVEALPPYSYSPNGRDLPQDCRVLQYYFNLGVQWYHLQQQQAYPATLPDASYPYQHHTVYMEPPLPAAPPSYPETTQGSHQPPSSDPESTRAGDGQTDGHSSAAPPSYPETTQGSHQSPSSDPESTRAGDRQTDGHSSAAPSPYPETIQDSHQPPSSDPESTIAGDGQTDGHSSGPIPSMEGSSTISPNAPGSAPSSAFLYPYQMPPPLMHLLYEAPPPADYFPSAPPLPRSAYPHPVHLIHRSSYHTYLPPSAHWAQQTRGHAIRVHCPASNPAAHWGALQTRGHATRVYCPAPNPAHVFGYIRAPPPYQRATHYIPPTI